MHVEWFPVFLEHVSCSIRPEQRRRREIRWVNMHIMYSTKYSIAGVNNHSPNSLKVLCGVPVIYTCKYLEHS